jgi:8-oxo-dGTP pyrophosphatase MutT (NUDIX family)
MKCWTNILKENNLFERRYFGKSAVGVIIKSKNTNKILVLKRSKDVFDGNTFTITTSGKVDGDESPIDAAKREIQEELQYKGKFLTFKKIDVFKDKNYYVDDDGEKTFGDEFTFYTYFAVVPKEFKPKLNWEHTESFWWGGVRDIKGKMHFGTKSLLKKYKKKIFAKKK